MQTVKHFHPVRLINPLNTEEWVCDDISNVKNIDGIDYITVHKANHTRNFLMRKDALVKSNVKIK